MPSRCNTSWKYIGFYSRHFSNTTNDYTKHENIYSQILSQFTQFSYTSRIILCRKNVL